MPSSREGSGMRFPRVTLPVMISKKGGKWYWKVNHVRRRRLFGSIFYHRCCLTRIETTLLNTAHQQCWFAASKNWSKAISAPLRPPDPAPQVILYRSFTRCLYLLLLVKTCVTLFTKVRIAELKPYYPKRYKLDGRSLYASSIMGNV